MIHFACPQCKTTYTVGNGDAGKKSNCAKCGQRLQIPAPPRNKTVLGEALPDPRHAQASPPQPSKPIPLPPATVKPIRFDCPHCKSTYTVNANNAGKPMGCKTCLRTITIPGTPPPAAPPEPEPTERHYRDDPDESANQNASDYREREEREPEPLPSLYQSYSRRRSEPTALANRVVAGIASGMLFIGLFMPMVHGPLGTWMSFIDVPWKAVTVGFMVADKVTDSEPEPQRQRGNPQPRAQQKADPDAAKNAGKGLLFTLVMIGSVIYPLLIIAAVGFTALQLATGRRRQGFVFTGGACAAATLMYAVGILLLNAIEELRVAMLMTSPGIGWAVMLIGSFALIIAGVMRVSQPSPQS